MKVLITGAKGQLGTDLVYMFSKLDGVEIIGLGKDELDITDLNIVRKTVFDLKPDVIVHSAAYTQVDKAESDIDTAYLVNCFGTRNVVMAASEVGAKVCYISTDYIFNGQSTRPYHEYDSPCPKTVYGKSKYAGEEFVKTLSTKYFIVRTSWVYGLQGNNFVKTMLKLGREKDELNVIHDQTGSPTYTIDLATFICTLVQTENYGIYHASNTGECTWCEFAQAIFEETGLNVKVNPMTTLELSRPAPRPKYSVLDHISIRTNGFTDLRHWRDGLRDFLSQLGDNY